MKIILESYPIELLNRGLMKIGIKHTILNTLKHRGKLRFIKSIIPESLKKLISLNNKLAWNELSYDYTIFTMWWQGSNNMPDIVKICHNNLEKRKGNHSLIILTEDNFLDRINTNPRNEKFPAEILSALKSGIITMQYFSDIVRTFCLKNFGGVWIDSTLFLTRDIDDIILQRQFYSGKRESAFMSNYYVPCGKWTAYFLSSGCGNPLMEFVHSGLIEAIQNYKKVPEYYSIDYLIKIAYQECDTVKLYIDSMPTINPSFFDFDLNSTYSEIGFMKLMIQSPFYKFDWRQEYQLGYDETPSYFSYLLKTFR